MKLLITGGAGYIGSCTANLLIDKGHKVTIIDNLSTGCKTLVPKKAKFLKINIQDKKILKFLKKEKFDAVMHFAAYIQVEESVKNPKKYLENNYENTKSFFKYCKLANLKNIVFSSTAAVYGELGKNYKYALETADLNPKNAYALSKVKVENYLKNSKFFKYIILRYFNVAGADVFLRSGQVSKKATHLIKIICQNFIKKRKLKIFGNDYPTEDGTAERDYIHVCDLAEAHLRAARYLLKKGQSDIFNCGYGYGYTVKKIVDTFNSMFGGKIDYIYVKRRKGDVARLVSNSSKIKKILKWRPKYNSIKYILKSHLRWENKKFNT